MAFSARSIAQQVTRATTPPASGASYRIESGLSGRIVRQLTLAAGVSGAGQTRTNSWTAGISDQLTNMRRSTAPAGAGSGELSRAARPSIAIGAARPEPPQVFGEVERQLAEGTMANIKQAPRHARLLAGTKPSVTPAQRAQVEAKKRIAAIRRPSRDSRGRKVALIGGDHPVDIANGLHSPRRGLTMIHGRRLPRGTPNDVREATPEIAADPPLPPRPLPGDGIFGGAGGLGRATQAPGLETEPTDVTPADAALFESIKFAGADRAPRPEPMRPASEEGSGQRMLFLGGVLVAAWLLFKGRAA
jgi:hypothetical protein